ncbi:hypothetical protein [Methanimicrococcus hongohii]|uniref:hypothetical protein n=1 Tax=Methanimicrococcus hongohii TaxID=3028295 RepID=UPI00292D9FCB|nr:hypothetical protein [Methanimicrococcus sp. Hf6]
MSEIELNGFLHSFLFYAARRVRAALFLICFQTCTSFLFCFPDETQTSDFEVGKLERPIKPEFKKRFRIKEGVPFLKKIDKRRCFN